MAHALFSLSMVLTKATHQKLDLEETPNFRPLSLVFGHINIDNLEAVASALDHPTAAAEGAGAQAGTAVATSSATGTGTNSNTAPLPGEGTSNYLPSRMLQFLIEQVRTAVRYAAMVLLDRIEGEAYSHSPPAVKLCDNTQHMI